MPSRTARIVNMIAQGQAKIANAILSLNPNPKYPSRKEKFSWGQYRKSLKPKHWMIAIPTVAASIGSYFLIQSFLPAAKFSVMSAIAAAVNFLVHTTIQIETDISTFVFLGLIALVVRYRKTVPTVIGSFVDFTDGMPQYAFDEEEVFRKGSENWTWRQRVLGCISFGLVHFTMLFVPIGILPGMSLAGAVFMLVYNRRFRHTKSSYWAMVEAATVHTTCNILIIVGGPIAVLIIIFVQLIWR